MGLGIVFSGQGNQSLDMFQGIAANPVVATELAQLSSRLGYPLLPQVALSEADLFHNRNAQPLIAGLGYLQWQILQSELPLPVAFAGYSLGELTAYAAAGAWDFKQLIELAGKRAALMDEAAGSWQANSLLAVSGVTQTALTEICHRCQCFVAIQNSAENWVVGGTIDNLQRLTAEITQSLPNVKLTQLKVDVASHTPLLATASDQFIHLLNDYHADKPLNSPVIASVNAATIYSVEDGLPLLARQIATTIHFSQTIAIMHELGATVILELGAGNALSRIIGGLELGIEVHSINDFKTFSGALNWVKKRLG